MGTEFITPMFARTGLEGIGTFLLLLATPGFVTLLLAAANLYLARKARPEDRTFHIDLLTVCAIAVLVLIACVAAAMQSSSEFFIKTAAVIYFSLPRVLAGQAFPLFSGGERKR